MSVEAILKEFRDLKDLEFTYREKARKNEKYSEMALYYRSELKSFFYENKNVLEEKNEWVPEFCFDVVEKVAIGPGPVAEPEPVTEPVADSSVTAM